MERYTAIPLKLSTINKLLTMPLKKENDKNDTNVKNWNSPLQCLHDTKTYIKSFKVVKESVANGLYLGGNH